LRSKGVVFSFLFFSFLFFSFLFFSFLFFSFLFFSFLFFSFLFFSFLFFSLFIAFYCILLYFIVLYCIVLYFLVFCPIYFTLLYFTPFFPPFSFWTHQTARRFLPWCNAVLSQQPAVHPLPILGQLEVPPLALLIQELVVKGLPIVGDQHWGSAFWPTALLPDEVQHLAHHSPALPRQVKQSGHSLAKEVLAALGRQWQLVTELLDGFCSGDVCNASGIGDD